MYSKLQNSLASYLNIKTRNNYYSSPDPSSVLHDDSESSASLQLPNVEPPVPLAFCSSNVVADSEKSTGTAAKDCRVLLQNDFIGEQKLDIT